MTPNLPPLPSSPPDARFRYRSGIWIEVDHSDGRPFYRDRRASELFDLPRIGVAAMNQTVVDMLQAQADLGKFAAELHAEDPSGVRIVPVVGPVSEQSSVPVKTPWYSSTLKGKAIMAARIGSSQQLPLSVRFRDRRGNPTVVDGTPEWLTDNSEVLALEPSEDGLSCLVKAVGPLGTASVTLSADAAVGDDVVPILGTVEIEVTAGLATTVELVPGTPQEQTEPEVTPAPPEELPAPAEEQTEI